MTLVKLHLPETTSEVCHRCQVDISGFVNSGTTGHKYSRGGEKREGAGGGPSFLVLTINLQMNLDNTYTVLYWQWNIEVTLQKQ